MRISELRLNGFKSFANKTTIKFDDNFIGIVGPNGSGKSNIIDAIRWVFGEQSSKSLRGKSSTDVIFGGTQTRKKANFAEVTIVLDNSDSHVDIEFNEVSVTRRLYRSGDSEYLINNVECRLKDIVDLFIDSGIGKNSFSIISQGKVEEIIVSKPESRRLLIEDISGVLKYKKRKETALKKLDKTQSNLEQVDLVLSELSQRLGPLKIQSEKAKEYEQLRAKLEQYEISFLANKIYDLNEDFKAYQKMVDDLNLKIVSLNNEISISESNLDDILHEENKVKSNISIANEKLNEIQEKIYSLQSNLKMISEREKILNDTKNSNKIASLKDDLFINKEQLVKISTDLNAKEEKLKYAKDNILTLTESITKLRNQRYDVETKLNDLQEESKRNQYSFSVKKLIQSKKFSNMKVLRDLFSVGSKYAEAINTCLGSRLNDVVLPDIASIKMAINYLRENKFGRATFINSGDVKYRKLDTEIENLAKEMPGFVDVAINLITCEQIHLDIFRSILNTTLIFDSIDTANNAFKKFQRKVKIVTLQGEVLANNGTISGGAFRQTNPLLLNSQIKDNEQLFNNIIEKQERLYKDLKEAEHNCNQMEIEVNFAKQQKESLEEKIKIATYELQNFDEYIDDQQSVSLEEDLGQLREEYTKLHNQKIQLETQLDRLNEKRENFITSLKNDNEEVKILSKDLNEYTTKISRMEVSIENLLQNLSSDYQLSFERAYELADKNINIEEYSQIVDNTKKQIKSLGIINPDAINEYTQLNDRYEFLNTQKNDLILAMDKLNAIMNKLDDVVVTQFSDAYNKLRTEFKQIFSELFGGGQADLILTNPDDMLTTGVEIVAQPPGKKLQTISLLSGGEKALTAISLLFAILQIKNVPFTILDEVEAALDEVNVTRYANYIKVFSERTQFLVITHRQGTMNACQSLYGITMVEKGVSSVYKTSLNDMNNG